MSNIRLTICIATYNRDRFIGETLDSIVPQLDDDVEILVVDGASTDNTQEIMEQYAADELRVRFVRLPAKGGVDQDYDRSVTLANGEYCWLFTDDDVLKPGAVLAVKNAIREGHDLIVMNAEVRDRTMKKVLQGRRIEQRDNAVYGPDESEKLFADTFVYLSFIGAVVIRTRVWLNRDRQSYFGTEFVHLGAIFQKPLSGTSVVIAEPLIIIRYGNAQWSPRSFDIWMFKWPRLVWSFENIGPEAKTRISSKKPWMRFKALVVQRSMGRYSIQIYRRYLAALRVNAAWKACAWIIAYLPRGILIRFHYLYAFLKGADSKPWLDNHFA